MRKRKVRSKGSVRARPRKRGNVQLHVKPASDALAWRNRIDGLLVADEKTASVILARHGFTVEQAGKAVRRVAAWGAVIDYAPDAPEAFRNPGNECRYAVQILHLAKLIRQSDPTALQLGRIWGRATIGLRFPEIAKSMQGWWLSNHQGPGGRKTNDLTRSLKTYLREHANAGLADFLAYLQSDEAEIEFDTANPEFHVSIVEINNEGRTVTYEDRARKVHSITFNSLDRKIRNLRSK
jgi:hypothetical protein